MPEAKILNLCANLNTIQIWYLLNFLVTLFVQFPNHEKAYAKKKMHKAIFRIYSCKVIWKLNFPEYILFSWCFLRPRQRWPVLGAIY